MDMRIRLLMTLVIFIPGTAAAVEKPNFLWITCEDISPYLGCYGCREAQTPYLDALAGDGTRYTRAYANAPVCAVARSALLTGMHSSTIGTHQMRSNVQLPSSVPAYPKIFREAGYYCTNNSKKDYNSNLARNSFLWDESSAKAHWRNREDGQPFFAVFNIKVTHEGQLGPKGIPKYVQRKQIPRKPRIDPTDIDLPPYHPDLPEIRKEWARFHDLITLMTMSPQWYERAHEMIQTAAQARGRRVDHGLQSNLIGYSDRWTRVIFDMFGGSVGSSLDYPNLHRKLPAGGPAAFDEAWLRSFRAGRRRGSMWASSRFRIGAPWNSGPRNSINTSSTNWEPPISRSTHRSLEDRSIRRKKAFCLIPIAWAGFSWILQTCG